MLALLRVWYWAGHRLWIVNFHQIWRTEQISSPGGKKNFCQQQCGQILFIRGVAVPQIMGSTYPVQSNLKKFLDAWGSNWFLLSNKVAYFSNSNGQKHYLPNIADYTNSSIKAFPKWQWSFFMGLLTYRVFVWKFFH